MLERKSLDRLILPCLFGPFVRCCYEVSNSRGCDVKAPFDFSVESKEDHQVSIALAHPIAYFF